MNLIHPGSWRFSTEKSKGAVKQVKEIYKNNKVLYAEFNDAEQGKIKFKATTDYDIMHIRKEKSNGIFTARTKLGLEEVNLNELNVIPTNNIKLFKKLKGNKSVKLINNYEYGTDDRFKHTSFEKTKEFKYPVVYGYPKRGLKLIYSNTNKKGHFGIPKIILCKASPFALLDLEGKYGMSQFASGLIDEPINLIKIKKVLETEEFINLKYKLCGINNKSCIIDNFGTMFKFLKEFKHDFWKEFYTEEMEQELINENILDKNGNLI